MRRISLFALVLASGALACASAEARTARHHRHHAQVVAHVAAPEIVVRKRSFTNSGVVVPVGSRNRYMDDSTIYNRAPEGITKRSEFGDEVLPDSFNLPQFQR